METQTISGQKLVVTVMGEDEIVMEQEARLILSRIKEDPQLFSFADILEISFVKQFIRGRKYDSEDAFKYLRNYLLKRSTEYAWMTLSINNLGTTLYKSGVALALKRLDPKGRLVLAVRSGLWDPTVISPNDGISQAMLALDESLFNIPAICENGLVLIVDMGGVNLKQASYLTPAALYRLVNLCVNSIPIKYKKMHLVNLIDHKFVIKGLIKCLKLFISRKLGVRIWTHKSLDSFHIHVPPNILPHSFGGLLSEEEAYDYECEMRVNSPERKEYYDKFKKYKCKLY